MKSQKILNKIIFFSMICIVAGIFDYGHIPLISSDSIIPILPMNDTTSSFGLSTNAARQVQSEYVSSTSSLVGKSIDTILVKLQRTGSPSGTIQIGIFNTDLSIKQLFGTVSASSVTTYPYTLYSFSLSSLQTYQVQSGDRIGIKFTGGNSSNYIAIMTDQNNTFDGTNSYLSYYTTSWQSKTGADLYMVLEAHPSLPIISVTPAEGSYAGVQLVTLTASVPSTIYYTTDGSTPTTSSTSAPSPVSILVKTNSTIQYFAKDNLGNVGSIDAVHYTITYPVIIQLNDTTSSFGLSTNAARQVQSEYVSSTSSLVGKSIDTILVKLQRTGSPSGTIQIGIFNTDLSIKQLFGTVSASSVTTYPYTLYSFSLSSLQTYQVQSGDRIGIKFTGGDASNYISIMTDQNNTFDGTNSYLSYYTTSWQSAKGADLYMILKSHVYSPIVYSLPAEGSYAGVQLVTLTASVPSTIYYTTDGSTPTTSSTSAPSPVSILVKTNSTIQYFAKDNLGNVGSIDAVHYTITYPVIIQLNDTTSSFGLSTNAARQVQSEYVPISSDLFGKSIDTIVVNFKKVGSPPNFAVQVGIFDNYLSVKQIFGTIYAKDVSIDYIPYSFSLAFPQHYKIQAGDRIGIKFTGGDASNYISIMTDQNNTFDGTNSYLSYYTTSWQSAKGADLYMILKSHIYYIGPTSYASPPGSTYNSPQSVTLATSLPSTMYYTLDGSEPTIYSTSAPSPASILINTNSTLKFFAKDAIGRLGQTSTEIYSINHHLSNGITKLYPTILGGKEWYANWYTSYHKLVTGNIDPYDSQFQARGNGDVTVNGDGTTTLNGTAPRMYVYDPSLENKWKNTEITIYAKRVTEQSQVGSQGITIGARSGSHDDVIYPDICKDSAGYPNSAYNGRITYDGRADYLKEVLYHKADALSYGLSGKSPKTVAAFPTFSTPIDPSTGFHTMPKNTWIGYKFVVRSIYNDTAVQLQSWMDLTNGKNGGTWTKINEYIDKGGWNATSFYDNNVWPCPTVPIDYVITHSMPYIFVRADAVNEIDYKNFSIREIKPLQ